MGLWSQVILKLFEWQVFALFVLLLVIIVFRRHLGEALRRGDVLLSWGENRSIRLSQLPEGIQEELDPILADVESLRSAVAALEAGAGTAVTPAVRTPHEGSLSDEERQHAMSRMHEALASGEYKWRTIERLAGVAGVTDKDALAILRSDPTVVLSLSKSQRQIARLATREPPEPRLRPDPAPLGD